MTIAGSVVEDLVAFEREAIAPPKARAAVGPIRSERNDGLERRPERGGDVGVRIGLDLLQAVEIRVELAKAGEQPAAASDGLEVGGGRQRVAIGLDVGVGEDVVGDRTKAVGLASGGLHGSSLAPSASQSRTRFRTFAAYTVRRCGAATTSRRGAPGPCTSSCWSPPTADGPRSSTC